MAKALVTKRLGNDGKTVLLMIKRLTAGRDQAIHMQEFSLKLIQVGMPWRTAS